MTGRCEEKWKFHIPRQSFAESALLHIAYRGDVVRLYADGQLIEDNFYNGRRMEYPLSRIPSGCTRLELRILPLQTDMPVYFPQEADTTPGEKLLKVTIQ